MNFHSLDLDILNTFIRNLSKLLAANYLKLLASQPDIFVKCYLNNVSLGNLAMALLALALRGEALVKIIKDKSSILICQRPNVQA